MKRRSLEDRALKRHKCRAPSRSSCNFVTSPAGAVGPSRLSSTLSILKLANCRKLACFQDYFDFLHVAQKADMQKPSDQQSNYADFVEVSAHPKWIKSSLERVSKNAVEESQSS